MYHKADPLQEFFDGLRKMVIDLNKNLEIVKTLMSAQHLHNEIFIEDIKQLIERVELLEKRGKV